MEVSFLFWFEFSKKFPLELESEQRKGQPKRLQFVENGSSWKCSFIAKQHLVSPLMWMVPLSSHSFIF